MKCLLKLLKPDGLMIGSIGEAYDDQRYYRITLSSDSHSCGETNSEPQLEFVTDTFVFAPLTSLSYQLSKGFRRDPFLKNEQEPL